MKTLIIAACLVCLQATTCSASTPITAKLSPEVIGVQEVFSRSGTMGFRILRREEDNILIGGKELLLTVSHSDPENLVILEESFQTCDNGNAFFQCRDQSTFITDRDCFNFIRIAENMTNNLLFVCGTNALYPRCYICNVTRSGSNISDISCPGPSEKPCGFSDSQGLQTLDGDNIAPKHWTLNATSAFADNSLYLGVSKNNDKSQTVVSTVDINQAGPNGSDTLFTNRLDTTSYFSRSVNEADFVGKPLVIGDRVYFFYREVAVEHMNQGSMVYSRVARVCKDDAGIQDYWSSFQKARLNCSVPGAFPTYYNQIQDIIVEERGGDHLIHAVFTGLPSGPQSSALCVYSLAEINDLFNTGRFRGPQSPQSIWLARPNSEVPTPRPGLDCTQPSQSRSFIEQFPLMQQLAENLNEYSEIPDQSDAPVLRVEDVRFSALILDSTPHGKIYYIATERGSILKAFHKGSEFKVFEMMVTADGDPIVGLQMTSEGARRHLLAVTDNTVYRIPLQSCATACEQKCTDYLHGYCEWAGDCCRAIGETSCAENPSDVHVSLTGEGSMTACENQRLQLLCQVETGPLCPPVDLTWTRDGGMSLENQGHLVSREELANEGSRQLSLLTVQTALAKNKTVIECTASMVGSGGTQSAKKTTQVYIENCITEGSLQRRYVKHMALQTENSQSQECNVEVFDCANCPARHWGYAGL